MPVILKEDSGLSATEENPRNFFDKLRISVLDNK